MIVFFRLSRLYEATIQIWYFFIVVCVVYEIWIWVGRDMFFSCCWKTVCGRKIYIYMYEGYHHNISILDNFHTIHKIYTRKNEMKSRKKIFIFIFHEIIATRRHTEFFWFSQIISHHSHLLDVYFSYTTVFVTVCDGVLELQRKKQNFIPFDTNICTEKSALCNIEYFFYLCRK